MSKEIWIKDILTGNFDGKEVELKGWIYRSRGSNKIRFIVIRDSTGHIQCVAKRDVLGDNFFEQLKGSLIESSVVCLLYTSPSPRDRQKSRMPSSA